MKIPVKWLSEYVDISGISDVELSQVLTMSGTENEVVRGVDFPSVVVGEIKEITAHPDADKLRVTKTDVGKRNGGVLQIVCGAPNIEVGQHVPVALVGAVFGEFEIKKAKIRGVESHGMLCSESELGISDDHAGIMILDPRAKVGTPLGEALNIGGTVLEAEITPNRSDCFSMIGIAQETAAVLKKKMKGRSFNRAESTSEKKIEVQVDDKKSCPRYLAKIVEGIKIGPSPQWMQERLEASGVRPINNVVDVTNYVMLEWGQPMHAFDLSKVSGKIVVRKSKKGEEIKTLDGVMRKLTEKDLVIADGKKVIGIAGVMGGANSEVTDESKTIVLEAAVFEGTGVRRTAQRLGLRTEASNRFEKGIPLPLPEIAIERAAGLLAEVSESKVKVGETTDVLSAWVWHQHAGLPLSRVKNFLGAEIETEKVLDIFRNLGFEANIFDFKKEARRHVGKPYVLGASYRTHGDLAFDCSYLTDYIYSQVGQFIGHTCLAQYMLGQSVESTDLLPGDILFIRGLISESATDHYYVPDGRSGKRKVVLEAPMEVGHCALYIGGGRIVHGLESVMDPSTGKIKKIKNPKIVEEDASVLMDRPDYLGARRFLKDNTEWIAVDVPWWRLDVATQEDLLEEVGRIYGFENIPGRLPEGNLPVFVENQNITFSRKLKEILSGAGYSEVVNYSFVSAENLKAVAEKPADALRIKNPISPEQEYMRTTLVSSILSNLATNQFNYEDIRIFEIASTYHVVQRRELPDEELELILGVRIQKKKSGISFFEAKGVVELIEEKLGLKNVSFKPAQDPIAGSGQAAEITIGGKKLGRILIPSVSVRQAFGIKTEVAIAQIKIPVLLKSAPEGVVYVPVNRYPRVTRDVNLILDKDIAAARIDETLGRVKSDLLQKVEIIDIYEGTGLPDKKKSVTIRMVMAASDRTLTEAEIGTVQNQVVSIIQKTLGGKLRG